ncbi:NAD(P)/FAD-dependent oxidoreductase [Phaeodactylibacter xiamenensis]|uniref:NAD(P)/FAD-dependent oxidoreductase n=1 Tax=Phaeodactylibacter xiamenensis TaxID=1524460 RepID=UPI0024A7FB0F|nr:FAD-dependent oxidoreductase [Phaeodactylibacter xiamenensis]
MKHADFIIVGQGIAGTLLAHFLEAAGKSVFVIDQYSPNAASQVAAGIINPITGRRYVKSWRVDDLIPFAVRTYRQLEAQLNIPIFHERNIIRTLFNQGEENDWLSRTGDPAYTPYMLNQPVLDQYATKTVLAYSYGEVTQSGQTDLARLTGAYRKYLKAKGALLEDHFDYSQLTLTPEQATYKNVVSASQLIFAEGHLGTQNPYFNYLPFGGAKGEVLIVRIPGADFEKILKHRVFIVPLADSGLYWIGSTYDWKFDDDQPTSRGRDYLEQRLKDVLSLPFEVVEHRAAVRPTVKDRRPFLGQHPEFPALAIFNGLGTKGASLGPYWAHHLAAHLVNGNELDEAVDIGRFAKQ